MTYGSLSEHAPNGRISSRAVSAGSLCCVLLGIAFLACGILSLHKPTDKEVNESVANAVVLDVGRSVIAEIERIVQPSIERGHILASSDQVIRALKSNDAQILQQICNDAIQSATEVDAIALFDAQGRIVALNSIYANGQAIDPQRLNSIMRRDFSDREIITSCAQNGANAEALEFQTTCDITPALFDSSGLAIANSLPIIDTNGTQVGVVSTRQRFERIHSVLKDRGVANGSGSIRLVTDGGGYFDEDINAGDARPPMSRESLLAIVAPLTHNQATHVTVKDHSQYHGLFRADNMKTLAGGGIQVMVSVPEKWMMHEALMGQYISAGTPMAIGGLFFLLGGLLESIRRNWKKRRALQIAIGAKTEFLANMSHEIRTPMTAIIGYTDLLANDTEVGQNQERSSEAVDAIQRNAKHLLNIINDVLDVSKIESGMMSVECIPVQPLPLVQEITALMAPHAVDKCINLNVILETPIPPTILSDPTRLRQVLINLINNAIKFTENGSVVVRLTHMPVSSALQITIEDSGIGMTPEQLERIRTFESFQQADGSTTREFGGTGLGLRISNQIVELLGGTLVIHSEFGKGSTFTITIATGDLTLASFGAQDNSKLTSPSQTAKSPSGSHEKRLQGLRILLAEDGVDNQKLISFFLRKAGADVTIAENGAIAVDLLEQSKDSFDLVLMDMQMPELDGYQATTRLRSLGYTNLPILALTAHAMDGDRQRCLDAGCDDFFIKPIDKVALIQACHTWTHRSENHAAA